MSFVYLDAQKTEDLKNRFQAEMERAKSVKPASDALKQFGAEIKALVLKKGYTVDQILEVFKGCDVEISRQEMAAYITSIKTPRRKKSAKTEEMASSTTIPSSEQEIPVPDEVKTEHKIKEPSAEVLRRRELAKQLSKTSFEIEPDRVKPKGSSS